LGISSAAALLAAKITAHSMYRDRFICLCLGALSYSVFCPKGLTAVVSPPLRFVLATDAAGCAPVRNGVNPRASRSATLRLLSQSIPRGGRLFVYFCSVQQPAPWLKTLHHDRVARWCGQARQARPSRLGNKAGLVERTAGLPIFALRIGSGPVESRPRPVRWHPQKNRLLHGCDPCCERRFHGR